MEFLRYFWEQKITPKKQSWSPRHVEKMMHYTSQKIAPFQALISSKLHSVQSWHLFCQPKTVSFTNPQVHGPPNPLLYRELDCIQIVIWPAQAILDLFTDLHPSLVYPCNALYVYKYLVLLSLFVVCERVTIFITFMVCIKNSISIPDSFSF